LSYFSRSHIQVLECEEYDNEAD